MSEIVTLQSAANSYTEAGGDAESFKAGARWLADQVLETLGCYATSLIGLREQKITLDKMYDRVSLSLEEYFGDIGVNGETR